MDGLACQRRRREVASGHGASEPLTRGHRGRWYPKRRCCIARPWRWRSSSSTSYRSGSMARCPGGQGPQALGGGTSLIQSPMESRLLSELQSFEPSVVIAPQYILTMLQCFIWDHEQLLLYFTFPCVRVEPFCIRGSTNKIIFLKGIGLLSLTRANVT